VKNKVAPPFKQAEFDIMYGQGISREGGLIDIGLSLNLINKSGSWLSYGEERLGQGRENVKEFLKEHPETTLEIESKIRAMIQANQLPAAKSTADAESVTED
jgi:recombination protein RecA